MRESLAVGAVASASSSPSPRPGARYVLRRPETGGDRLYLVEVGAKRLRHDPAQDRPADDIEILLLGRCDANGRVSEAFDPPMRLCTAPGALLDARWSTPLREPRKAAA